MTKEEFRMVTGKRLKEERLARNLYIDEIAEAVDLSPTFYALIEQGKRGTTLFNICKIAEALDISVDSIVFDDIHEMKKIINDKRSKVNVLTYGLTVDELDFVAETIAGIRRLRKLNNDKILK